LVDIDRTLSAGEAAPDYVLPCKGGALDWVLALDALGSGGRMEFFLVCNPAAGRGRPAIDFGSLALRAIAAFKLCVTM
jgi:hypothetical protein